MVTLVLDPKCYTLPLSHCTPLSGKIILTNSQNVYLQVSSLYSLKKSFSNFILHQGMVSDLRNKELILKDKVDVLKFRTQLDYTNSAVLGQKLRIDSENIIG